MVWGFCVEFLFCGVILGVLSSLAITLLRKREQVALMLWLLVICLQSVIVAFPGHTHFDSFFHLFLTVKYRHPAAFFNANVRMSSLIQALEGINYHFLDVPEGCHLHPNVEVNNQDYPRI